MTPLADVATFYNQLVSTALWAFVASLALLYLGLVVTVAVRAFVRHRASSRAF